MPVDSDTGHDELMARLALHRSIGGAPHAEHEWLAAHGVLRTWDAGAVVTHKGEPAKLLIVVLSGRLVIRSEPDTGSHKILEWRAGDVGGVMPYSRLSSPPHDVVAEERTEAMTVDRESIEALIHECPTVTATLVHAMVDRAREFKSSDLRDEKLKSLGKLAAGLAHELNNPASALTRSARVLRDALGASEVAARGLAAARLSDSQFAAIEAARTTCGAPAAAAALSTIARADREDAITEWLEEHGAGEDSALALADTGVSVDALDTLATHVTGDALDAALHWLAASCLVRALSTEIETAAARVSDLVGAVKGFSFMDHAPAPEPVDIARGIADTFTMLGAKTRSKSVAVSVDVPEDLPRARAVGAELNQVWMNLIDNALDAVADGGHVTVSAARVGEFVVVKIVDDGPGIPAEVRESIFEPFFTTKGVGKGTGLGLDIAKRLLLRHDGGIDVESVPGRTEFQVRLPTTK